MKQYKTPTFELSVMEEDVIRTSLVAEYDASRNEDLVDVSGLFYARRENDEKEYGYSRKFSYRLSFLGFRVRRKRYERFGGNGKRRIHGL